MTNNKKQLEKKPPAKVSDIDRLASSVEDINVSGSASATSALNAHNGVIPSVIVTNPDAKKELETLESKIKRHQKKFAELKESVKSAVEKRKKERKNKKRERERKRAKEQEN